MTSPRDFPSLRRDGLTLILGLGETGVAAARWCAAQGVRLRVLDTRARPGGLDALKADGVDADLRLGPDALTADALDEVHTLVLSPGLSPLEAPVAGLLAAARERGVEILGEIELFARALGDLRAQGYAPALLAVTGTNGKTTVTSLTRHLVETCGRRVRAAGNIGPAALASLKDALEQDDLPEIWVLELSSFQLESTFSLAPDAATVLNVTQDHLDWHGSMRAYAAAKARLLEMARIAVVNRDDPLVRDMVGDLDDERVRGFGADAPTLAGDFGLLTQQGLVWLATAPEVETDPVAQVPARRRRAARDEAPARRPAVPAQALMPAEALRIQGTHNALNALAALALCRAIGLEWAPLLHALRGYRGEAHRTEFVRAIAGVDFIDDSKGTNVGATLAALKGLGRPVVLIAGGLGKGQDFAPLAPAVRAHARAVLLIGQDGPLIGQALADCGVPLRACATLEDAVAQGLALARPGDAVLLSPACASMDMFRNYAHRSECFVEAVRELAIERGEIA
ncbi:UDP-N-acetylmuramoyl-L-alanine--D-glutamate ligase [Castellaniella denitrificans]|uniref:UDP-N-acetylmuramoylalanine--D-glutamate ligase n=1 Tax=Castellaniella denitrificans TaxID=56119 RepID=A0ABT4M2G5_9BURK|nr:UDP-N-acetylmuramoyl-L-alanine--D-glutamate ligase [Castellaniella denitrificans]MCZ4329485.1 UDP-N-acetylmuramoyl-L-alanine--D-glutamate ligase [Castellaniella denitrificans]